LPAEQTNRDQGKRFDQCRCRNQADLVGLFKRTFGHVVLAAGIRQLNPAQQKLGDRTANDTAQHQAKSRAGQGNFGRRGDAGAVPAGERNRAGQQAKKWRLTERQGEQQAGDILQYEKAEHHREKNHQGASALAQAGQIGIEPDTGEKGKHQRRTKAVVELHLKAEGAACDQ
jgi:hypothetical protein